MSGRPKRALAEPVTVELDTARLSAAAEAVDAMSVADMAVIESTEFFVAVGRIQTAQFIETVSSRIVAEQYLKAKGLIGKLGSIPCRDRQGRAKHVSSLEDFCDIYIGLSQRRCQQLASNVEALGAELYDQAERIGFRARDYQALKALPDDAREVVKKAIAAGDRDSAIDALQDMAARVEAAQAKLEEANGRVEAQGRLLETKNQTIDRLSTFTPTKGSIARDEEQQRQLKALYAATNAAEVNFIALANVVEAIHAGSSANHASKAMRDRAAQAVQYLVARLAEVIDEHGIEVSLAEALSVRPDWLDALASPGAEPGDEV